MIILDVVPPDSPEELGHIGVVLSESVHRVREHDGEHLSLELVQEVLGQVDRDDAAVAVSHNRDLASWRLEQGGFVMTLAQVKVWTGRSRVRIWLPAIIFFS